MLIVTAMFTSREEDLYHGGQHGSDLGVTVNGACMCLL